MTVRSIADRPTAVGLSYCNYIPSLLAKDPSIVDFIEIPFEMLIQDRRALDSIGDTQTILHCASLSMAGNVALSEELQNKLSCVVAATNTPWIGEHLAYVRAHAPENEPSMADAVLVDPETGAYNVGYTVSPQYSHAIMDRVVNAVGAAEDKFGLPVLLENGPVYFSMPGSTMTQAQFISELCDRRPETKLLLDLSHLEITARNTGADVSDLLEQMPLSSVVEVHLSGHSEQEGTFWDDHAQRAPEIMFELLAEVMKRTQPKAITLEYNWDSNFPMDGLKEDVIRTKKIVGHA